jgi:oligopeptidase B
MNLKNLLPAAASLLILSCNDNTKGVTTETTFKWPEGVATPTAEQKEHKMLAHGDERIDNYYWMNAFFKKSILDSNKVDDNLKAQSEKVVDYLKAENAYVDTMMSSAKEFRKHLYDELKGRIKEKDESVPYKDNGYWYYTRVEEGKNYAVYCRKKETLDAPEEIIHNANQQCMPSNPPLPLRPSRCRIRTANRLRRAGGDSVGAGGRTEPPLARGGGLTV